MMRGAGIGRAGAAVLFAVAALALSGCGDDSPEGIVEDVCRKTHSGSVCECVVKNIQETGHIATLAENIDGPSAKLGIQAAAAVCAAQQG